jgi:hypothetical protein
VIAFSPRAAVRAAGPAVAAVLPAGWPARAAVVAAADMLSHRLGGRTGITIIGITPRPGERFSPAAQVGADAAGTLGWTGATTLLLAAAGRLPIPRPVTGLALGTALYVAELQAQAAAERAVARAELMRATAAAAVPPPTG